MADIYNGQLDAFGLYHKIQEDQSRSQGGSVGGPALPALGHAVAGSAGSAISNIITYPLALIVTRLQVQRQSKRTKGGTEEDEYKSIQDALVKIYSRDGVSGLYRGADAATVKTVADSFLFFLSYNFLRQSRLYNSASGRSSAVEELKIGFLAGAFAKFLTTPIANVVTRKQLLAVGDSRGGTDSVRSIVELIHRERGMAGFWSGYSASLILTLNPSLTFCFFDVLKKVLLQRESRANPPARATFLLAALSKAIASTITYPFSLAKTRLQVSSPNTNESANTKLQLRGRSINILSIILQILREEGAQGLYDGIQGEVAKGFLSHGITMLTKGIVHGTIIRLYYIVLKALRRYPNASEMTASAARHASATAE